jgi:hypothetical protein
MHVLDKLRVASSLKLTYRFVRLRCAGTDAQKAAGLCRSPARSQIVANSGIERIDRCGERLVKRADAMPGSAPIIMDSGIRRGRTLRRLWPSVTAVVAAA